MDKKVLIGAIIIFVMVFSIFGFVLSYSTGSGGGQTYVYEEIEFKLTAQGFRAEVNNNEYLFSFFPQDIEYITVDEATKNLLKARVFTVTYDPNSYLSSATAGSQYYLEQQLKATHTVERALTNSTGILPGRTCSDGTEAQPVIFLQQSDESGVSADENCVIIKGIDEADMQRQTERVLYVILGVMK